MSKKFELEKQMSSLDSIISNLESDELTLENQLLEYENGMKIIKECREYIEKTEQKIIDLSK
ncbi:MAG: exodeoxyribonuclease VII small subunit [Ignavibacteriae bacterium HGW-Ignavibacteriae-4]|jgi:exodeoxyribonuclease VII small subunit|nr:MAG: exodeoxyribonuclease VII small subunit [Ignavibacteriae bacterium HGW-Ignavibacteriae-4]